MRAAALLLVAASGCYGTTGGPETAQRPPRFPDTPTPPTGRCAPGLSQAEVDAHLAILPVTEAAFAGLVDSGKRYLRFVRRTLAIPATLATDGPESVRLPNGFSYDASGTYAADGGQEVRVHWGDDYEAGSTGERIEPNIFDPDNYLENIRLDVDTTTFEVLLRHDGPGPLVELLGFGPTPGRPVRIDADDIGSLGAEFRKLRLDMDLSVLPAEAEAVTLLASVPQKRVGVLDDDGRFDWVLDELSTVSIDPGQALGPRGFALAYLDDDRVLDGQVGFGVTGGDFDFDGRWTFSRSIAAARSHVRCRPPGALAGGDE